MGSVGIALPSELPELLVSGFDSWLWLRPRPIVTPESNRPRANREMKLQVSSGLFGLLELQEPIIVILDNPARFLDIAPQRVPERCDHRSGIVKILDFGWAWWKDRNCHAAKVAQHRRGERHADATLPSGRSCIGRARRITNRSS